VSWFIQPSIAHLERQLVVFLAEFRHRKDVRAPKGIALAPVNHSPDLDRIAVINVKHQPGVIAPELELAGRDFDLWIVFKNAIAEVLC
jgi:hypothetical protein